MVEKIKQATRKLITIAIVLLILIISLGIIAYGKGWRLDVTKKSVKSTGLISVNSQPSGAQVFVDGVLKTATNNAFNLDPGWYTIRIVKEGYLPWEKKLRVQGEVAVKTDALLFPGNPSLSPLTTTGILKPTLSPDGTRVAYLVPGGLWLLELSDKPFGPNRDPQQLAANDPLLSSPDVALLWSPDSREVIIKTKTTAHLYTVGKTQTFTDVSINLPTILKQWESDRKTKVGQKLAGFPQEFSNIASNSAHILSFSPDENKILYEATVSATIPIIINPPLLASNPTPEIRDISPGKLYVYDTKEDKNFTVAGTNDMLWFPTSNHLLLSQNGKIDIMEYDGANRVTVYAGPFTDGFLAPWPNGSRLVILTNLNPGASSLPNLYSVNLR